MLEVHVPSQPNRQEAFWYYGQQIATYTFADGTQLVLESAGEVKADMMLQKKLYTLEGSDAVHPAQAFDWTDETLADQEKVVFQNNNWLAIRKLEPNTQEGPDDDVAICHTYSDGIQLLLEEVGRILSEENNV